MNGVVLGACPCHVEDWRNSRGDDAYPTSLSPHSYVDDVAKDARVFAITGSKDNNTTPDLAKFYVNELKDNGVDATYIEIPGFGHNLTEETASYHHALLKLLVGRSYGTLEPSKECPYCGNTPKLPESAINLDIDAEAQSLIKVWGEHAARMAKKKADTMEASGDSESQAIWLKVKARIEKQQN